MRRMLMLLVGIMMVSVSQSSADPVIDWNATAITVMLKVPALARSPLIDLTYVHIAIYDAVNAIDDRYAVFAVSPSNAAPWASKEAATAAAAYRVLSTFYASQQPYIDSVYAAALALLPDDSTKTRGIAIGDTVATRFLALRAGDGRETVVPYTWLAAAPGVYQPTPPGAAQYQPINTWFPQFRPFSLESTSQFRAPAPPSLSSGLYTRDFDEVKSYGSRDSALTTAEQREMARFHTENPNVQLSRNIRLFAASQHMSISDNARLFAQLYVAINDALLTGFESKYYYNAWRPSTAIRGADGDANPLTDRDTSWLPLVNTPPHPEYPAAHGCANAAFAFTLEKFFGTAEIPVTITSTVTGTNHSFSNINEIITESANARVYGGMHFRNSVDVGADIGRKVAQWVANRSFYKKNNQIPTAGLQLWLRADAGVDTLNGTVSTWHDQSGNGNDALQPDISRQPFLLGNAVNGKPALKFDGVNDRLGFTGTTRMSQFSIFIVQKIDSGAADEHYYYPISLGDNTGGYGLSMRNDFSNNSPDEIDPYVGVNSWVRAVTPGCAAFGQWKSVCVIANTSMWNTTMHVNGVAATITPQGSDNAALSVPLGNATGSEWGGLGMTYGNPLAYLIARCHVAEVLVYGSALSDSARQAVENYLNSKYGLVQPSIPTAGLQLWLRADAGVDTLNGTVSTWHDQSGNGNDVIQATTSRQPLLVADALNGKPMIRFDGVDDKLGFTGTIQMTQFSLFLVINNHLGQTGNSGNVMAFGAGGHFNNQWFMGMRPQFSGSIPSGPDSILTGTGYETSIWAVAPTLGAYDQWRNLSVVTTGSVWSTRIRRDGIAAHMSPKGVDDAINVSMGDSTGSGGGIGGADGVPVGSLRAKCDVAEMLVYNVALSDSLRTEIEGALARKYGLFTGVADNPDGRVPKRFVLAQNYPNPFNPSTSIRYELPLASKVSLIVYNLLGQEVMTLVDGEMSAGAHEVKFNALNLSSGVYLYRIRAGDFVATKRLVLLK